MSPGTLRSIEGFGVPLLVMVSIVVGTFVLSRTFTAYQAETDARIERVENTVGRLANTVERLADAISSQRKGDQGRRAFDRIACQELMMALQIENENFRPVDCFQLPSALRQ